MDKICKIILAAALGIAVAPGVSAQTDTRAAQPRDGQDRRDIERDRDDARQAIERDLCGDLSEGDKERCVRTAYEQRAGTARRVYRAPAPVVSAPAGATAAPTAVPGSGTPMQGVPSPGAARSR